MNKALGKHVIVKRLDENNEDFAKSDSGIFIKQVEKPTVGHYEIISIGDSVDSELDIDVGDTVWISNSSVITSSNFEKNIAVVKGDNIFAKD